MSATSPVARSRGWAASLALAAGCLLLVAVFFVLLFPWARLRAPLERAAGGALGGEVRIGRMSGGLLGLRLEDVRVRRPGEAALRLEAVRVRPALSAAWLRGVPALAIDAAAWGARVDGTAVLDPAAPGFDGRVDDLDPTVLPAGLLDGDPPWLGAVDADVDLVAAAAGPRGRLDFEGADGAVAFPGLPFALPYDRVAGRVELADDGIVVEALALDGPMLSAAAAGRIGPGDPARAPVDLELTVHRADANVRDLMERFGIPLGPDGAGRLRIQGSLSRPRVTPLGG
ncbi:MAG: type II secretion system protein GspN [Myxococcota bacterium]|nr:type II secretion system protein GspN [Myxococcota bacterium]